MTLTMLIDLAKVNNNVIEIYITMLRLFIVSYSGGIKYKF